MAFANSRLYDLLIEYASEFNERGLFIAGDAAYGLTSFLQTPYDASELKGDPAGMKDAYNYHLSSCRIYIECAFGELVMRWGILWRTLLFSLKKSAKIVQACMLLQNFIINNRDITCAHEDSVYFRKFSIDVDDAIQQQLTRLTGELPRALVSDNNKPNTGGRRSNVEEEERQKGLIVRDQLIIQLAIHGLKRPMMHKMQYNLYGHIYFD
jgi:DDE superfamily endonuclease